MWNYSIDRLLQMCLLKTDEDVQKCTGFISSWAQFQIIKAEEKAEEDHVAR